MRINVQLIDAESGAHLWAERFDKPLADFFDRLCHVNSNWPRGVRTTQAEFMRLSQLATSGKLVLGRRGGCGGM
jgi:hypothetical protein